MRNWLTDLVIVAILGGSVIALSLVRGDDDPAWEERWRALSPTDRARIAEAARSGALLASQEEIELAAGFARRDRRRRLPWTFSYVIRLVIGLALLAGGLVADSIVLIVFGAIFFLASLWAMRSTHQVARAEREAIARNRPL